MVWLRYKTGATVESYRLNTVTFYERDDTEREESRTLRGDDIDHLMSYRSQYEMLISADELADPVAAAFMRAFWTGAERFIALSASETVPTDPEFIGVTTGSGVSPVEFIEGWTALPEWPLTLVEKKSRL